MLGVPLGIMWRFVFARARAGLILLRRSCFSQHLLLQIPIVAGSLGGGEEHPCKVLLVGQSRKSRDSQDLELQ